MSEEAYRLLLTAPRRKGCPYILPSPNDPTRHMTEGEHYGGWTRVLKTAGVPTKVDMKLTGHKIVAMFMHYVHTEDKPVRDAAETVANRRLAITGARRTEEMAI